MVLAGEVDLLLPEEPDGNHRTRLVAGPARLLPRAVPSLDRDRERRARALPHVQVAQRRAATTLLQTRRSRSALVTPPAITGDEVGFTTKKLFEGPTGQLRRLHSHLSVLTPGAGYAPHIDAHDVRDRRARRGDRDARPACRQARCRLPSRRGVSTGSQNPNGVTARYLVIEFHGSQSSTAGVTVSEASLMKVKDPKRWRRRLPATPTSCAGPPSATTHIRLVMCNRYSSRSSGLRSDRDRVGGAPRVAS